MTKSMPRVYNVWEAPNTPPPESYPEPYYPTVLAAAQECDINNIVVKLLHGHDPGVRLNDGSYRDNSAIPEMKANLDIIMKHNSAFAELPSELQREYRTPARYYEALQKEIEHNLGTSHSLDVSGPTDSKTVSSQKKGALNEEENATSATGEEDVPKGHRHSSKKHGSST